VRIAVSASAREGRAGPAGFVRALLELVTLAILLSPAAIHTRTKSMGPS
jgi:hypothetical protein